MKVYIKTTTDPKNIIKIIKSLLGSNRSPKIITKTGEYNGEPYNYILDYGPQGFSQDKVRDLKFLLTKKLNAKYIRPRPATGSVYFYVDENALLTQYRNTINSES